MTLWFRAKFFLVTPIVCFATTMLIAWLYTSVIPLGYFTEPFFLFSTIFAHSLVVGVLYQKELFSKDAMISEVAEKEGIEQAFLIRFSFLWVFYIWLTIEAVLTINYFIVLR